MGFEAPGTGKILTFEGTPYEGLEVTVDSASIGLLTGVAEHYEALAGLTAESDLKSALPALNKLLSLFAGVLEGWNVTKRGKPVPATLAGLQSLDVLFVIGIVRAWLTGSVQADEELGKDSGSGETSPEALTAAAALSSALPSSEPQRLLSGSATGGTACRRRCWLSPRGCCGCSTSTGWGTAKRNRGNRREVSSHS